MQIIRIQWEFSMQCILYLKICGEIKQREINRRGYELLQSVLRGENIDNALEELSNNLHCDEKNSDEKIELYVRIIATTRMIGAIH